MSRSNARSRRLGGRPSRTVPASIVAVILLAIGALAAVLAIARLVNGTWPSQVTGAASSAAALTWGSVAVIAGGAVVALVGLVLLVAGVTLGAFKTAQLQPGQSSDTVVDTDFVISTRAMARLAAARADQVDGVDKVSASASGRRVRLKVTTTSEQADEIRDHVQQGVSETLSGAGVRPMPRVIATVRTKGI
jgi:hypothetical protein